MAKVSFRNVWKKYGNVPAVKDLNIECPDGSFLSILGPSGCGKSSTMRMVAGLEHITSGQILFDEKPINALPPKDRDVAMVFENYALYPHKSVFDNMANPLKLRGQDASVIKERVTSAAKLLEISHLLERRPQELSGGQKQRVAIGRAIVREPNLFLFDEPIAHLDAKLRAHMRGEIKHLQRTLGTTMIYVTHDQLEAMSMADTIAVMHDGELQQLGTPREVYNKPVNAWVAGFVGEPAMNFVDAAVSGPRRAHLFRASELRHRGDRGTAAHRRVQRKGQCHPHGGEARCPVDLHGQARGRSYHGQDLRDRASGRRHDHRRRSRGQPHPRQDLDGVRGRGRPDLLHDRQPQQVACLLERGRQGPVLNRRK